MKLIIVLTISLFLILSSVPIRADSDTATGELFGLKMQVIAPFPDVLDDGVTIDTVRSGTFIHIKIGYHNPTDANYEDFTITSYFPNRLESYTRLVSWDGAAPSSVDPDSNKEATWKLGTLYPNQKDSLTFTLYVNTAPLDTIYLSYQTIAYATRTPITQISHTHIYVPGPAGLSPYPSLWLDKIAGQNYTYPGDTLRFSLNYGNTGEYNSLPVLHAVIYDTLPAGFTFLDGDRPTNTKSLPDGRNLLTWQLPSVLIPGTQASLNYRVRVDFSPDRKVETINQAFIISQTNENDFVDNDDQASIWVQPKIDLAIRQVNGPVIELDPNGRYTFALRCSNHSSLVLNRINVKVSLLNPSPLLSGFIFNDFGTGWLSPDRATIHWQISHLPAQGDTTITFVLALSGSENFANFYLRLQAEIANSVNLIDGDYEDVYPIDNQVQWLVYIDATPDLAVQILTDSVAVQTDAICQIQVICRNLSAAVRDVTRLRIFIDDQITGAPIYRFTDFSSAAVAVNPSLNLIEWQVPPLARSDSAMLSFNLICDQVAEYGNYVISLKAVADSIETGFIELENNSASTAVHVDATPDFSVRLQSQDDRTSAEPGSSLNFTMIGQNHSARALKNTRIRVRIDDQLPTSNLYTIIAEAGIGADSTVLSWEIPPLAYQEERELFFRLNFDQIASASAYEVKIVAAIDSVELNPTEHKDNVSQLSIHINAAPQITLGPIIQENAGAGLKSPLSYRIPCTNIGNFSAQNLVLTLELPVYTFLFAHWLDNNRVDYPDSSQKVIRITIPELRPQEQKELQIQARVFSFLELPGSAASPLRLELKATLNDNGNLLYANHVMEIPFDVTRTSLYLDQNIVENDQFPLGISFAGNTAGTLEVKIYNLAGEFIKTVYKGPIEKGVTYQYHWSGDNEQGNDVASGVYFVYATAPSFQDLKKVIIVR